MVRSAIQQGGSQVDAISVRISYPSLSCVVNPGSMYNMFAHPVGLTHCIS